MTKKSPKNNNNLKNIAVLSGIAIEMGIIIFLFVKGGKWLDEYFEYEKNLFLPILTMVGVGIAIWLVLQRLKKLNN